MAQPQPEPTTPLEFLQFASRDGLATKRFRIRQYLREWRQAIEASPLFIANQFIILELPLKSGVSPTEWELQLRALRPVSPAEKLNRTPASPGAGKKFRIG